MFNYLNNSCGSIVINPPCPLVKGESAQLPLSYCDVIQNFYELDSKEPLFIR